MKPVEKPSFPSADRPQVAALDLNDTETDRWDEDIHQSFRSLPKHQLLGFPSTVQGDGMELECQLVSNGIYCGNSSGLEDPRAAALAPGEKDWRLLLQIDTDEQLGLHVGRLRAHLFLDQGAGCRRAPVRPGLGHPAMLLGPGDPAERQVDAAAILQERRGSGEDAVDAVVAEARWTAQASTSPDESLSVSVLPPRSGPPMRKMAVSPSEIETTGAEKSSSSASRCRPVLAGWCRN